MIRAAAERDDQLRAEWTYDFLATYSAEQMVVLDESSKDSRSATMISPYLQKAGIT